MDYIFDKILKHRKLSLGKTSGFKAVGGAGGNIFPLSFLIESNDVSYFNVTPIIF